MFDPFGDYDTAGYLRNAMAEKDPEVIKHVQHNIFRANLSETIAYLTSVKRIKYTDFLEVHRILFGDFYPWAGTDRRRTPPSGKETRSCPTRKTANARLNLRCTRRKQEGQSPPGRATSWACSHTGSHF